MAQKKRSTYIRSIEKIEKQHESLAAQSQDFPKDKPGVIYVRQSTIFQVQQRLHSFEMQTSEFEKYFREVLGVTGHIEVIADDEGKSGTLDIHNRKGLSRVMRLIEGKELLGGEQIGWVGAVYVNRLTRDQWLIVPGVLMKECYEHDVWIATLNKNFNFKDDYCRRVFMMEAEEGARTLKWMKDIMGGARTLASQRGVYDGRQMLPGYLIDYREYLAPNVKNPAYKKHIVYEPHAIVIRWLFQRFLELDGNFTALADEVRAMPYLFPALPHNLDQKCYNKFSLKRSIIKGGPYTGFYAISKSGLKSILTNPVYRGWWVPMGGGLIEDHHDAIVSEELFFYAFKRLSTYDLQGQPRNPIRMTRNGAADALLKKVACGTEENQCVYAVIERQDGSNIGQYTCKVYDGFQSKAAFAIRSHLIDEPFVEKFKERLVEWQQNGDLDEWREKQEAEQKAKGEQWAHIDKAIREAKARMQRINELITDTENPVDKEQEADLKQMYRDLSKKVADLQKEKHGSIEKGESEEVTLYQIQELIPRILDSWEKLPFSERLSIVGAFTRKAIFSVPTAGWIKLEIEWKIGSQDILHLQKSSNAGHWTDQEDQVLRDSYITASAEELLQRLPNRTWKAIIKRSSVLRIPGRRPYREGEVGTTQTHKNVSLNDKAYAEANGLDTNDKNAQWCIKQRDRTGSLAVQQGPECCRRCRCVPGAA